MSEGARVPGAGVRALSVLGPYLGLLVATTLAASALTTWSPPVSGLGPSVLAPVLVCLTVSATLRPDAWSLPTRSWAVLAAAQLALYLASAAGPGPTPVALWCASPARAIGEEVLFRIQPALAVSHSTARPRRGPAIGGSIRRSSSVMSSAGARGDSAPALGRRHRHRTTT